MKTDPDKEVAAGPKTQAGTAMERSNLYGFLAAVFREEPTAALLREIREPAVQKALKAAGVDLDVGLDGRSEEDLLEGLAVEYTRLFIGPGRHIPPYAAVHLGGEGASLWGPETTWFKGFIEDAGFNYRPDYHDLPDHVSVELEFMREITAREARALAEEDEGRAKKLRRIEREFLGKHLALWILEFCRKVAAEAELPFYREVAVLSKGFVESELADISDHRQRVNRDRRER
ncbi:MAG: molecular chaperone TorD family protein [Alphaproteobacteria bacterium]